MLLAATGPAAAAWLSRRAAGEAGIADRAPFTVPIGCVGAAPGSVICLGVPLRVASVDFGRHAGPGEVLAARRIATGEGAAEDAEISSMPVGDQTWQLVQVHAEAGEPDRVTAAALFVDGAPAPGGLALRGMLAVASLRGATRPARLVTVSAAGRAEARAAVEAFLRGQGDFGPMRSKQGRALPPR